MTMDNKLADNPVDHVRFLVDNPEVDFTTANARKYMAAMLEEIDRLRGVACSRCGRTFAHTQEECAASAARRTVDGPLGGFAPVGPEATQLDFMLTQFQLELQAVMDDATSVEDSVHHDAEAMKIKREIIERFARSSGRLTDRCIHGVGLAVPCDVCPSASPAARRTKDGIGRSEFEREAAANREFLERLAFLLNASDGHDLHQKILNAIGQLELKAGGTQSASGLRSLAERCRPAVAHYQRTQERASVSSALSSTAKDAAEAEAEKLQKLLDEIDTIIATDRQAEG